MGVEHTHDTRADTLPAPAPEPAVPSPIPRAPVPLAHGAGPVQVGHAEDHAEHDADLRADRALARLARSRPPDDVETAHRHDPSCGHLRRAVAPAPASSGVVGREGGDLPSAAASSIEQLRGGGRPLDALVRARMEDGFGTSFAGVRIHDSPEAARLNRSVSAQAFTTGRDVFFGAGQYAPDTPAGERVLAHELAHTLQPDSITRRSHVLTHGSAHEPQPGRTPRGSAAGEQVIRRTISISPQDYLDATKPPPDSPDWDKVWRQYWTLAIRDDLRHFKAMCADGTRAVVDNLVKAIEAAQGAAKIAPTMALISALNGYAAHHSQMGSSAQTRYAVDPLPGYEHTPVGGPVRWKNDQDMHDSFAAGLPPEFADDDGSMVPARGSDKNPDLQPVSQLPFGLAVKLLPRPLINLILDVSFQLAAPGRTPIDERSDAEKRSKKKTPSAPGTLRSWHQDSAGMLPDNGFSNLPKDKGGTTIVPPQATALHHAYSRDSTTGSGASIGEGISGPIGYAEYTGTGSDTEHNTKVVLDYISRRVYLTLTHYQYWVLLEKEGGSYEFVSLGTQERHGAEGELKKRLDARSAESPALSKTPVHFMNPWVQILLPGQAGAGKEPSKPPVPDVVHSGPPPVVNDASSGPGGPAPEPEPQPEPGPVSALEAHEEPVQDQEVNKPRPGPVAEGLAALSTPWDVASEAVPEAWIGLYRRDLESGLAHLWADDIRDYLTSQGLDDSEISLEQRGHHWDVRIGEVAIDTGQDGNCGAHAAHALLTFRAGSEAKVPEGGIYRAPGDFIATMRQSVVSQLDDSEIRRRISSELETAPGKNFFELGFGNELINALVTAFPAHDD